MPNEQRRLNGGWTEDQFSNLDDKLGYTYKTDKVAKEVISFRQFLLNKFFLHCNIR